MLRTIMVETGESPEALAAMKTALSLAKAFDARVIGMAHLDERAVRSGHVRRMLEDYLRGEQESFAARCRSEGVPCVCDMSIGGRRAILAKLSLKADLLIVGEAMRPASEGGGFHSSTVSIAREMVRDVLFVGKTVPAFRNIIVGYAGRENSCNALRLMAHIAEKFGGAIHLVTSETDTIRAESLLGVAQEYLESYAAEGVRHHRRDEAAAAILTVARQVQADAIAMGAYRTNMAQILAFGATSTSVLTRSPIPVFACR